MTPLKTTTPKRQAAVTEPELVRRAQAGDAEAFREIVARYQSRVYSLINGILRSRNDADDVAQQVFTKIYYAIRSFDSRSSLSTWIYRIAVNECYGNLRKRQSKKIVYESECTEKDRLRMEGAASAFQAVDEALWKRDFVNKLLSVLPKEERTLLVLKEVEGHSVAELAAITRLNENTIKVKLHRARRKLLEAAQRVSRPAGGRLISPRPSFAPAPLPL